MIVVSGISDCGCNTNERTCWTYFFNLKKMKRDTIKLKFYCVYLVYCLVINSVFCRLQFIMLLLKCRYLILNTTEYLNASQRPPQTRMPMLYTCAEIVYFSLDSKYSCKRTGSLLWSGTRKAYSVLGLMILWTHQGKILLCDQICCSELTNDGCESHEHHSEIWEYGLLVLAISIWKSQSITTVDLL